MSFPAAPPPDLMFRVTGQSNVRAFNGSGAQTVNDYGEALRPLGRPLPSFRSVLDFGAGCGRVLRHLLQFVPCATVTATDIDTAALGWIQQTMPSVQVFENGHLPPLPFDADSFDLILALSVFTHFPRDYQDAWLAELQRVTVPGGIVLASVQGVHSWLRFTYHGLSRAGVDVETMTDTLLSDGYLYYDKDGWEHYFPDAPYYHSAWNTAGDVRRRWAQWFDVLDYRVGGAAPAQDLVVLRRR